MKSTQNREIMLPHLSSTGRLARVFPALQSGNLLSLGQILDDDTRNKAVFTNKDVTITKENTIIAQGTRNPHTQGMWHITLPPHHQQLNVIIHKNQTKQELAKYLHAACFSPTPTTLIKAIQQGYLTSWPGLTTELISKHLPPQPATIKGHLDQEAKCLQSTKTQDVHQPNDDQDDTWNIVTQRTNNVMVDTIQPTNKSYSDLTGHFPHISRNGYQYIFIMYHYDTNAIIPFPMKDRTEAEHIKAWNHCYKYLRDRGQAPIFHVMDNETSNNLLRAIEKQKVQVQLVPPHVHRRNAAERAIRTFKNHFIAGLCSVNPQFPMNLWADLLPQAALTLNMLRPCRLNPKLSAYTALEGNFDFNKTPLAPPGTKVIVHQKSTQRATWSPHGLDGWYIGPALNHYRCVKCYIPSTNAIRIADTVKFLHHNTPLPTLTPDETIISAANDLTAALQDPHNTLLRNNTTQQTMEAVKQLTELFAQLANKQQAPSPRVPPPTNIRSLPPSPRVPTASPQSPPPTTQHVPHTSPADENTMPSPPPPVSPVSPVKPSANRQLTKSYHPTDISKPYRTGPSRRPLHTRLTRAATRTSRHLLQNVLDPTTGNQLAYKQLIAPTSATRDTWLHSMGNEIGRLAQGIPGRVKGTDTIFFIPKTNVPQSKKVTYARIVPAIRPQKEETHRIRVTVGGNLLTYDDDAGTPTTDLTTAKLFFNSIISTPNSRFINLDVKDFYLNNTMPNYEYMKIHISLLPDDVIAQYNLRDLQDANGFVYMEIRKGMYGLKQAGRIAYNELVTHLAKYGYVPSKTTQGLWHHKTRPIQFILVVDDFGVKYTNEEDVKHLIQALQAKYTISIDWSGSLYCGLHLNWNYDKGYVDVNMPNYITTARKKYQHPQPNRPQHAPAKWTQPAYGVRIQYTNPDTSAPCSDSEKQKIQQIIGTLLYYARAVDPTMLVALNDLSHAQANPTATTTENLTQLLDYAATHPDATIRYYKSDMILWIDSDAAYLVAPKARSRVGGYFKLSSKPRTPLQNPPPNGPVHVECTLLKQVVAAAAEAELGAAFVNAQKAVPMRQALTDMGHPQPPTPIKTDNSTAYGILTSLVKQKRSKAFDMQFYWLKDRIQQKQFQVYWKPGNQNLADYVTKHHPPAHHKIMRTKYLLNLIHSVQLMRGCVNPVPAQSMPNGHI